MNVPKYIFENGVMKINPAYKQEQANSGKPSTVDSSAIAIVSSTSDIAEATEVQRQATGDAMRLSESTTNSMEIIQDKEYTDKFHSPTEIDGGVLLEKLSNEFAKYEVPVGLINKLLALQQYRLNFIMDDSGSMGNRSDADIQQVSRYVNDRKRANGTLGQPLTRWEEAEDRLHVMIDMLQYIPSNGITISFLNRTDKLMLDQRGKSPEQFAQDAHMQITNIFNRGPNGGTPAHQRLSEALNQANGPTMHYMFTDGVPTDASIQQMKDLVAHRNTPQSNPLTFMSCTDQDDEAEWMKEIEETAPFCAELDDFDDEKREVLHDQGPAFPFSRGFWLLCQMVAAINPDDLDAMDESKPVTKYTLDTLMGRVTTAADYKYYWDNNPNARNYNQYYQRFATEQTTAGKIIPGTNPNPGYPGGGYPNQPPTGGGYPNQPPTGGGYPNQPPTGGGYPNQPPTGGGYPNQPPTGGGYPNQPPTGGGYPNQPPAGGGYPNQPPTGGGYPNGGYPNQPGMYPNQPQPGYPSRNASGFWNTPNNQNGMNNQQPVRDYSYRR